MDFITKNLTFNGKCNLPKKSININIQIIDNSNNENLFYKKNEICLENDNVEITGCPENCEYKTATCTSGQIRSTNCKMFYNNKRVVVKGDKITYDGGEIIL